MADSIAVTVLVLAGAYGMSYWAHRAQHDPLVSRLLIGVLGALSAILIVAGLGVLISGSRDGAIFLGSGIGLGAPLSARARELFARFTHIDPDSRVDMAGLSTTLALMIALAISALRTPTPDTGIQSVNLGELLVQVLMFAGLAVILAGAGISRPWQAIPARLAIRPISWRVVAIALAAVLPVLIISGIASQLTHLFQPHLYEDLQQVSTGMTTDVQNPVGAVALGLSAGIGEELLMRGALQPRFGIFLTSLFWAILHTQYGLTFVLAGLFSIGFLFGKMRDRYGVLAPLITHAAFNALVILAQSAS